MNKAKDSTRKADFKQIRIAMDTFYNDRNCYPTSLSFGQEWKEGDTIYMKKVPQDPSCGKSGSLCYSYVADTTTACPQWHVLFGKLAIAPPPSLPACLLQSECLPSNYAASGYNLCDFGGNIDCETIQSTTISGGENEESSPSPTPTIALEPTATIGPPMPTPTSEVPGDGYFYCGCGNNHVTVCNVTFSIPQGVPYYVNASCSNQCGQPC